MKGLEAIVFHDGGTMATAGIVVVFFSLIVLSFIISQLHRLLLFWEKKADWIGNARQWFQPPVPTAGGVRAPDPKHHPPSPSDESIRAAETLRQFNLLITSMKEPFSLPDLIEKAEKRGIGHPHSRVNYLLLEQMIIPDENGFYSWNHDTYRARMGGK